MNPPHPLRRDVLLTLASSPLALLAACQDKPQTPHPPPTPTPPPATTPKTKTPQWRWETLEFPPTATREKPQRALFFHAGNDSPAPLLVLLHGRSETRSLDAGAHAWRDDYALKRALKRISRPPLLAADFEDLITTAHLDAFNQNLQKSPFQGIRILCPYTPDLIRANADASRLKRFANFITQELIPTASKRSGGPPPRDQTGIDGVSLGGRVALLVGLSHPETFGAVSGMQPALTSHEASDFANLAKRAYNRSPQHIRLITSTQDPFRAPTNALSKALKARNIDHRVFTTPGPHDYVWNRGPGSVQTLLWFDKVLRARPLKPSHP